MAGKTSYKGLGYDGMTNISCIVFVLSPLSSLLVSGTMTLLFVVVRYVIILMTVSISF